MNFIYCFAVIWLACSSILSAADNSEYTRKVELMTAFQQQRKYTLDKDEFIRDRFFFDEERRKTYDENRQKYLADRATQPVETRVLEKLGTRVIGECIMNQKLSKVRDCLRPDGALYLEESYTEQDKLAIAQLALEKCWTIENEFEVQHCFHAQSYDELKAETEKVTTARDIYALVKKAAAWEKPEPSSWWPIRR